jgi:hypothetical protein
MEPSIELTTRRPRRGLDLDGWSDFPAICCLGKPLHIGTA